MRSIGDDQSRWIFLITAANTFSRPGEIPFEARFSPEMAGIGGLNTDPYLGDPPIGRIRRLYVAPNFRRLGSNESLMCFRQILGNGRNYTLFSEMMQSGDERHSCCEAETHLIQADLLQEVDLRQSFRSQSRQRR